MADRSDFKSSELRQNEIQLARSIEKNALLVTKLEEAQDEIERSHEQIASQLKQLDDCKSKIKKLEEKNASRVEINLDSDRSFSSRRFYDDKDKRIEELQIALKNKERVVEILTSNQVFSQEKIEELRKELEDKNRDMEILQKRLKSTEKSIDNLFLNHKTEGEFVSELEHLKLDNQRLMNLLAKSSEYKILAQFCENSEGAHYVPSAKPMSDETYNWVPSKVTKALEIYKQAPDISEGIMNTLLLEINKAFRDREKAQISKLKHEYQTKIDDLKRQLLMRPNYDTVKTQRQNSRLKSELKKATEEISFISLKQGNALPRMQDLEETLKIINHLKQENAKLNKENNDLKRKSSSKSQFLEGVGWLGEKVMKEKSQMNKLISNLLKNFEFDGTVSREKQEWLMDNIEGIVEEFSSNVEGLVDSHLQVN